jgi:tripartite-type tricarboxylate transporter receptor subunit TctC
MKENRMQRRTLLAGATAAGLAMATGGSWAQSAWPNKPVNLVVPFPAGGGTDAFARPLAAQFSKVTGKTLVIDNRGGAGGTVGASYAAKGAPDGYTLFMGGVHHAIAPSMYPKLDYNIEKDFIPLALLANVPQVLVVNPKAVPANFKQFLSTSSATPPSSTTARPAPAPRTTWLASCSSSKRAPSSRTFLTAAQARRCKT